jgi:hypothetical protein
LNSSPAPGLAVLDAAAHALDGCRNHSRGDVRDGDLSLALGDDGARDE